MNPIYYQLAGTGLFFSLFPGFWLYATLTGRYRKSLNQRLGCYPDHVANAVSGSPRVWIHAVSVGEVGAAVPIVRSLKPMMPGGTVILSTTTEHGQAAAQRLLGSEVVCIYAPVDFIVSVRRALTCFKPDVMAWIETEIWPNWILEAKRRGVKTALINGRISVRSLKNYLKIRLFMGHILKNIDAFSMISYADAHRIKQLGAPADRVVVNGNAKYDRLIEPADPALIEPIQHRYGLSGNDIVLVAGSTRTGEEELMLDCYAEVLREFPQALLILAPRHIERSDSIKIMVESRGFSCQFRTELESVHRTAQIVILNTIGELQAVYGVATIVFCGASLLPLGGQNMLEAAVWGKPVFYGPYTDDFVDAVELLHHHHGGVQVANTRELCDQILYVLRHPEHATRLGTNAQQAVMSHTGVAHAHARIITELLNAHE